MTRAPNELMARRMANELLATLDIQTYPVDPITIAERSGVQVEDISGFPPHCFGALTIIDGRFRILVSTACPTPRHRRFTVCHEIGHASIDGHVDAIQWVDQGGTRTAFSEGHFRSRKDPVEVEADHFASELLMPGRWARPVVDMLPVGLDAIRTLSDRFEASLSSAAVRYAQLAAAPVAVVLARGDSIEWVCASPEVQQADFFRYNAIRTATIPQGSATRRLATTPDAVLAGEQDSSTDLLCEWFPRAPKDLEVVVDALGLGAYGRVLSLLFCPDLPEPDEIYLQEQLGEDRHEDRADWRSQMRREAGYGR